LQIRDSTGARIMFPTDKDDDKEVITIVGKKESVEKAKAELEATIKEIVSKTLFYFLLLLMASVSYKAHESHNLFLKGQHCRERNARGPQVPPSLCRPPR
jgi:hypothetical protein